MKRIVMLNCLRANSVCTGAACLQAFNAKTKTFARYGDEPLELVAFFAATGAMHHRTTQEWRKRSSGFYSFGLTLPIWAYVSGAKQTAHAVPRFRK